MCEPVSCTEPDWERVDPALACPQKDIGNYSVQMLVNCFCLQEMDAYRAEHGWTSMFTMWFDRTAMCETFAREWGLAQVLPMIAPLAVVIINALLKVVLTSACASHVLCGVCVVCVWYAVCVWRAFSFRAKV